MIKDLGVVEITDFEMSRQFFIHSVEDIDASVLAFSNVIKTEIECLQNVAKFYVTRKSCFEVTINRLTPPNLRRALLMLAHAAEPLWECEEAEAIPTRAEWDLHLLVHDEMEAALEGKKIDPDGFPFDIEWIVKELKTVVQRLKKVEINE